MAETAKDKTIRYLNDAQAWEVGAMAEMKNVAGEVSDTATQEILNAQVTAGQTQLQRLEARLQALGGKPNQAKSAVNTVLSTSSYLSNVFHDHEDKQTQDVIKLVALAHFQVGAYQSLHAYAHAIGDNETADLAETLMNEEVRGGEQLLHRVAPLSRLALNRTSDAPAHA